MDTDSDENYSSRDHSDRQCPAAVSPSTNLIASTLDDVSHGNAAVEAWRLHHINVRWETEPLTVACAELKFNNENFQTEKKPDPPLSKQTTHECDLDLDFMTLTLRPRHTHTV